MRLQTEPVCHTFAWAPSTTGAQSGSAMLVAGSVAEAMEAGFSSTSQLSLYSFDSHALASSSRLTLSASVSVPDRFHSLDWSSSADNPIIAGAFVDGHVGLYRPSDLLACGVDYSADRDGSPTPGIGLSASPPDVDSHPRIAAHVFKAHNGAAKVCQFNHKTPTVLVTGGSNDRTLKLWDLNALENPSALQHIPNKQGSGIRAAAWHPLHNHILGFSTEQSGVHFWDLRQRKEIIQLNANPNNLSTLATGLSWCIQSPMSIALSRGGEDSVVEVWDLRRSQEPMKRLNGHNPGGVLSVAWCPTDDNLLVSTGKDGRTLFWDVRREEPRISGIEASPPDSSWVYHAQWAPTELPLVLATASFDSKLSVYSAQEMVSAVPYPVPAWLRSCAQPPTVSASGLVLTPVGEALHETQLLSIAGTSSAQKEAVEADSAFRQGMATAASSGGLTGLLRAFPHDTGSATAMIVESIEQGGIQPLLHFLGCDPEQFSSKQTRVSTSESYGDLMARFLAAGLLDRAISLALLQNRLDDAILLSVWTSGASDKNGMMWKEVLHAFEHGPNQEGLRFRRYLSALLLGNANTNLTQGVLGDGEAARKFFGDAEGQSPTSKAPSFTPVVEAAFAAENKSASPWFVHSETSLSEGNAGRLSGSGNDMIEFARLHSGNFESRNSPGGGGLTPRKSTDPTPLKKASQVLPWNEVLAVFMTQLQGEAMTEACCTLGRALLTIKKPTEAATCFIFAGNLNGALEAWSALPSSPPPVTLVHAMFALEDVLSQRCTTPTFAALLLELANQLLQSGLGEQAVGYVARAVETGLEDATAFADRMRYSVPPEVAEQLRSVPGLQVQVAMVPTQPSQEAQVFLQDGQPPQQQQQQTPAPVHPAGGVRPPSQYHTQPPQHPGHGQPPLPGARQTPGYPAMHPGTGAQSPAMPPSMKSQTYHPRPSFSVPYQQPMTQERMSNQVAMPNMPGRSPGLVGAPTSYGPPNPQRAPGQFSGPPATGAPPPRASMPQQGYHPPPQPAARAPAPSAPPTAQPPYHPPQPAARAPAPSAPPTAQPPYHPPQPAARAPAPSAPPTAQPSYRPPPPAAAGPR